MTIHVALHHRTSYHYDRPITVGPQIIRLRPAPHCRTRILSYSLRISPQPHFINWQQDPEANYLARLVFPEKTTEFTIEVDLVAEMAVINPFDFFLEPYAEQMPFAYAEELHNELAPYRIKQELTPLLKEFLSKVPSGKMRTEDFLVGINQRLSHLIGYTVRMEPGVQEPEHTLKIGSGSCRDSSWLLVQIMRHLGLAARFVSGYLIQLTADQKSLDGPSGPTEDFTDLHAWCEVYLPGAGWVGLDPTSGLFAGEGHIPLSCTPEPSSAAPVSGLVDPCEVEFEHEMSVSRFWESPRVTKPYSEDQWTAIDALGDAIDLDLAKQDVRLTMGGEPTFVALDHPEDAEWNTAALGATKKPLAAALYRRMRERYAVKGLTHFGQGKWYPGEQLPRWALNCFWRADGKPVWNNPALIADETKPGKFGQEVGAAFLKRVAQRLSLATEFIIPAYEDVFYYLWRERRLPVNVDPLDTKLDDAQERARLAQVFSDGLGTVVGHLMPLVHADTAWKTGSWFLRSERCYLFPGDSAMGYRLPLDSQPWASETDTPVIHPADPTQTFPPLPPTATADSVPAAKAKTAAEAVPVSGESAGWISRTALCAEVRNGVLYLFMPPLARLEEYLTLTAIIEATAEELKQPVMLEGYEPPADPRLRKFSVTPDPGVIEVNIHPARSWREMVAITTDLYADARIGRLSTEKFMLDGRHSGTGGGNHIVMGGATTTDSPFLRRPDLLRSLISYWHNHPSLSYLFSGMFIGPTSQAPRLDEARNDTVAEIELAFTEMQRKLDSEGECAPWLLDRLLRNLLTDVTGNTHRSEFCIDKMFSPDSTTGRLGLLEMRAFEMPPHERMSLTQQLLLRSLVARFWKTPYAPPRLVRWGTELHDRFMLPHFIWQDFSEVMEDMQAAGYPMRAEWFKPHFEFRFPKIGDLEIKGIALELRTALEPWHVLGEESSSSGTARYVDSSLERVQVKVSGMAPDRYVLTCNGVPVPLQPTGRVGEFVSGVRYRAWQPPSALHPTIGIDSPLTFDLVDTWNQHSLGGCQYHVVHPGGRSYDSFPVNAFEAESRRMARYFRLNHTPGPMKVDSATPSLEFPFTLDLRHF
ncbi:transglutaminase family protein [Herbaspirillum sp. RTI4]|uniref:transglutaminase family protein n=1 Tax=Herbaspirillum sp. RTI4 TaxID=3048640 RepID=UPI002AB56471|nr:transglutaminase family protein [Herbaspirillum sp. RTI4]MDY7576833.1 transglutaminase family protein [Herbaspirillum sp. RTI4]MEA9981429.1 transglutaminase family protein [Herbaspirillum sp. RTI4]